MRVTKNVYHRCINASTKDASDNFLWTRRFVLYFIKNNPTSLETFAYHSQISGNPRINGRHNYKSNAFDLTPHPCLPHTK